MYSVCRYARVCMCGRVRACVRMRACIHPYMRACGMSLMKLLLLLVVVVAASQVAMAHACASTRELKVATSHREQCHRR